MITKKCKYYSELKPCVCARAMMKDVENDGKIETHVLLLCPHDSGTDENCNHICYEKRKTSVNFDRIR